MAIDREAEERRWRASMMLPEPTILDKAQDAFRAGRTGARAANYLTILMEHEEEGQISDDTFHNGLAEIRDWLAVQ